MPRKSFAQRMKEHQISWARKKGWDQFTRRRVEEARPWVLTKEHKSSNLYEPMWWQYIAGREHKWARSLVSSQCFAVNLFGPLAANKSLAREALADILPERRLEPSDEVAVCFEQIPSGAQAWLGELKTQQPTQVDVFFSIERFGKPVGHLLVEVKLTETKFGSCRGGTQSTPSQSRGNPDPDRCRNLKAVMADPVQFCWMAGKDNDRLYWKYMLNPEFSFNFTRWSECPFRQSLYQLMRNHLLSCALVQNTTAEWAETGVCLHPDNKAVRVIAEGDAIQVFNELLPKGNRLVEINPSKLIATVRKKDQSYEDWAEWMLSRYDLR